MQPIAMGSLYMDKGEGLDYLTGQIERMAAQAPEYYFFDIICKPDQLIEATALLVTFYALIAQFMPDMPKDRIFSGVTCDEMIRPAASALVILNKMSDVKVKDINPERPGR